METLKQIGLNIWGIRSGHQNFCHSDNLNIYAPDILRTWYVIRDIILYVSDLTVRFYALEFTQQYKVFTLYRPENDRDGRSGAYVATTLYVPHGIKINRTLDLLRQISDAYHKDHYDAFGIPNTNLDYVETYFELIKNYAGNIVREHDVRLWKGSAQDGTPRILPFTNLSVVEEFFDKPYRREFLNHSKVLFWDMLYLMNPQSYGVHFANREIFNSVFETDGKNIKPQFEGYGSPPVEREFMDLPQSGLNTAQLARGRTDLYLIGLPGSGKTSLLAGVLKYLTDTGGLRYVTDVINSDEKSKAYYQYYQGLINGLGKGMLPLSTKMDTLVPLQFNIGSRYKCPLTIVEHSGKALKALSEALTTGGNVWNQIGVGRCLKNDNPKTLLFLFDYEILTGRNHRFSVIEQELMLNNVLSVFSSDGTGRYGDKGCTMSKVKNVAVVITKSDLMEEEEDRPLTYDERSDIAFQYLMDRCSAFMNHLGDLCVKFDINANNKDHPNEIYVTNFSLESFTDGELLIPEPVYAMRLAEYIVASTPPKRGLFGWL